MSKTSRQSLPNCRILSNYKIVKKIGQGLTAQVFLAKNEKHGDVSIKVIQPNFYKSKFGYQLINNQIKILKDINHKHILKLIETLHEGNKNYIITEYCEGKNLQQLIKYNQKISQKKSLELLLKIVKGCIYLKQKQIVHRDLKPSNIFIKNNEPIIADFGFATYLHDDKLLKLNAGSPLYMPYESLTNKIFSEKSDVFALGVILVEMLTGRVPWQAQSEEELKRKLKNPPSISKLINIKIRDIIFNCLAFQPGDRPTYQQLQSTINNILETDQNNCKKVKQSKYIVSKQSKVNRSISFNVKPLKKLIQQNKENIPQTKIISGKEKLNIILENQKNVDKCIDNKFEKDSDFINLLSTLNANDFTFLPLSFISKFNTILNRYRQIMGVVSQEKATPNYQQGDKLMTQIKNCNSELQLCNKTEDFIRCLLRLTKSYKQHRNCIEKIQQLYRRVQLVIV